MSGENSTKDIIKENKMKAIISCILGCLILTVSYSSASAADNFYLIGPGDVLEISVWNEPDLSKKLIVPPDGVISFPLINPIKVTNLTDLCSANLIRVGLLDSSENNRPAIVINIHAVIPYMIILFLSSSRS